MLHAYSGFLLILMDYHSLRPEFLLCLGCRYILAQCQLGHRQMPPVDGSDHNERYKVNGYSTNVILS